MDGASTVGSNVDDPVPANNEVIAAIDALAQEVDLGLTSQSDANVPILGVSTYRLRVTNHGPATATGLRLTGTFPESVTVEDVDNPVGTCTSEAHTVTCEEAGPLAAGSSTDLVLALDHTDPAPPLSYSFAVTSDLPEVTPEVGLNPLEVVRIPPLFPRNHWS